jgi:hypothetical protein
VTFPGSLIRRFGSPRQASWKVIWRYLKYRTYAKAILAYGSMILSFVVLFSPCGTKKNYKDQKSVVCVRPKIVRLVFKQTAVM